MKSISDATAAKIRDALKAQGCSEVFLFGSQVSGRANENSDIDIGVRGLAPQKFFSAHAELENLFHKNVDLVDFDEKPKFFEVLNNLGELRKIG